MFKRLYQKLFFECYKNKLKFWECPQALFLVMGVVTIIIMLVTFALVNIYSTPEMVVGSVTAVAIIMTVIGDLIAQSVNKINQARRQAEEEKRKTESIIMSLSDGLIMLNSDRQIILINPKAEEYLETNRTEIINKDIDNKNLQKKIPLLKVLLKDCSFPFRKIISREISFKQPKRFFKIFIIPVRDFIGKFLGHIIILHDITRAKALDQMKSEFISIASHQLRGPLSSLKWLIELLSRERLGRITEQQRKFLEEMRKSNEKMIRLVSELLDVSRFEEGRAEFQFKKVDIRHLIQEVISDCRLLAVQKKIKLEYKKLPQPVFLKLDEDKIKMVVQNLIENAIKYTKEGGKVSVCLEKKNKESLSKEIKIKEIPKDFTDWILVSVSDTGIGISNEEKTKIFSKFYRSQRAKKMEVHGTGLGLYMSKQIIEKHKGKIWFKSQEDKGTTFYFLLPIN